ncbi:protein of unknown function (DUF1903), putative [Trypanosoma equiperdum]|uniref:Uncharacterized protein n=4 Tax=Trypanozoon TaxID=39700 RepID=Q382F7_TRYB2|nr:hypothetical protein, conserved [Trypanosoma brucei gambiense DAL972]XP_829436.1 hypothetical protein, conserved [Trypanosoma brucei brucei TREU927]RHW68063.1 hypothetical protein DPX39_110115900 [Trypanosoma brucei equiperdum]SCU66255.1 Domain of unknown function (DUF1903), putative [Trypanosoma equiperdum]EAN80324.1 hypothetical protein, conserved [Trypanosoma brucei brucei TREU927]CBH18423.1 hypothetical protein, conserved [Trypanosoma brucei gambiense DAL972]|eukprot:XP_011780687.1 hypothetical protein, conserved [Trypanosoma brucei gambiense DAL972]
MDSEVCDDETNNWRACVEDNLSAPDLDRKCSKYIDSFNRCIASWRTKVGYDVKVRGENEGEPPPQCAAMSCLIGACLRKNGYSFERCKLPMHYFKHCVKSFYGSEYVT